MEKKEYKIGEVFEFEGRSYKSVEDLHCNDCALSDHCIKFVCGGAFRSDRKYAGYIEISKETSESNSINWEQRRYELAKAAMQGILADNTVDMEDEFLCKACISAADEMIKQLKQ